MNFMDPRAIKLLMSKKEMKNTHTKKKEEERNVLKVLRQEEKYSLHVLSSACQDKETSMDGKLVIK